MLKFQEILESCGSGTKVVVTRDHTFGERYSTRLLFHVNGQNNSAAVNWYREETQRFLDDQDYRVFSENKNHFSRKHKFNKLFCI
ncbi:hypothetical protein B9Z55_015551 [Caenorhabditis nigoni]|uniref:Uncharacterized protein n=1 Tax=Caenorhabditis nigoni TaxID=1611254 RepID=A0A2G5UBI3_9PELO|nr:hypothetical protein B9Z55_015551 [Caenorhabditis nigoni]